MALTPYGLHLSGLIALGFGQVSGNGAIAFSQGVASVVRNRAGEYVVTMTTSRRASTGNKLIPVATADISGAGDYRKIISVYHLGVSTFGVHIVAHNSGSLVDSPFTFAVFSR